MRVSGSRLMALALATALASRLTAAAERPPELRGADRLTPIFDEILAARFDRARTALQSACPPAPVEACHALGAVAIWWQIVLDPDSRARDAELERAAMSAVADATAWTVREPQNGEAFFYLAAAYAPLTEWRILRGQRLAAARDGNRIRSALERALALDPSLVDAKFGLGLYHYIADVAPAASKVLRWLLLLPGGDRELGLREMLEARDRGVLLRGEADFQLHRLYLWYEHQPGRALELLAGLDARFPSNPIFLQRTAEVLDQYLRDHPGSAEVWQQLLDRARAGRTAANGLAEARARLGLAVELEALHETDRAMDHLQTVARLRPSAPFGATARAHLLMGEAHDRLGEREAALAAYRRALDEDSAGRLPGLRSRAQAGLRRGPDQTIAQAYRLSLDGWRALERGEPAAAVTSLARATTLAPGDAVMAYRYARALAATGDRAGARRWLERVVQSKAAVPAFALSAACVDLAALIEQTPQPVASTRMERNDARADKSRDEARQVRSEALSLYERGLSIAGGDHRAQERARAAIARLRSERNF